MSQLIPSNQNHAAVPAFIDEPHVCIHCGSRWWEIGVFYDNANGDWLNKNRVYCFDCDCESHIVSSEAYQEMYQGEA